MTRRREVYHDRGPQPPPPPISVVWASPPMTKAGHCPKCGRHIGYAVRAHAKDCAGPVVTNEAS